MFPIELGNNMDVFEAYKIILFFGEEFIIIFERMAEIFSDLYTYTNTNF